jgi:positive regulator of sigma E activity
MAYLKYVSYLFLLFAIIFTAAGVLRLTHGEDAFIDFMFAGISLFLFFFRRRYYKKFRDRANGN